MKLKNLKYLKNDINKTTLLIFFSISILFFISIYITHLKFLEKNEELNEKSIYFSEQIFKSNLSENISIIANSKIFIDYLHSGNLSRKILYYDLMNQIHPLTQNGVIGIEITDIQGNNIFNYGEISTIYASLNLCYMNQTINANVGECRYFLKLYFDKNVVLEKLQIINPSLISCEKCKNHNLFENSNFASFPIQESSTFNMNLTINNDKDYFFYIYFIFMTINLLLFGTWNWYRLNNIINTYIAYPIKVLTNSLKESNTPVSTNNLDEINFLVNEINNWKDQLNQHQVISKNAEIGKIALQVAHDIRSPLAAIGLTIHQLEAIPEKNRILLNNAAQRISDIANNLLHQYRQTPDTYSTLVRTHEYIPSLLENIISEKKCLYDSNDIDINLQIDKICWNTFSFVNANEFKIIISNLINNARESIKHKGFININLTKSPNHFSINIKDSGQGISAQTLDDISNGYIKSVKPDGSGLGLPHAIKIIEYWGGTLQINSQLALGTNVAITIPLSKKIPSWFSSALTIPENGYLIILDDEVYSHDSWDIKFHSLQKEVNFKILHFYSAYKLKNFLKSRLLAGPILYLVDYDLNTDISGLDLIKELNIQDKSRLVTNHFDNNNLQEICSKEKIQLLPKNCILHVEIKKLSLK